MTVVTLPSTVLVTIEAVGLVCDVIETAEAETAVVRFPVLVLPPPLLPVPPEEAAPLGLERV